MDAAYFMGREIRRDIGDYNIFCPLCIDMYITGQGLNDLDWIDCVDMCEGCMGTNRAPIPLAEVMNLRGSKRENEQ